MLIAIILSLSVTAVIAAYHIGYWQGRVEEQEEQMKEDEVNEPKGNHRNCC
jgi:hypothetical protein